MTEAELLERTLYRDGLMLVVDKPAGIAVHKPPGGGESLEDYFDVLRFGLPRPPALAHRLDRPTSGCLVLGRHPKALRKLAKLFADGLVIKNYWAIVHPTPQTPSGLMDLPLLKRAQGGHRWQMMVDAQGKPAQTEYRVLGRSDDGTGWLELKPLTGRTHQLRVHCADQGFAILGDSLYGDHSGTLQTVPLQLHARRIEIPLTAKKAPIVVEAEPPDHMLAQLKKCGYWSPE
ncbi:MAG: RluA family pseudouridine synthase [Magnetococcales bacterium]|nr:RluA family pseudouridine synthase [Magnetococcales bacterium]